MLFVAAKLVAKATCGTAFATYEAL